VSIYKDMQLDLSKQLTKALKNNYSTGYILSQIKQINKLMADYDPKLKKWADDSTQDIYQEAYRLVKADLTTLGVSTATLTFGKLNQDAISILAQNSYNLLKDSTLRIGRAANDELRSYALESIRGAVGGYETMKEASTKTAKAILSDTKFTDGYVTYKNGAKVPIETYARMTAETTTAQVHRAANENAILEAFEDNDAVQIVGPEDEKNRPACAEWVGKIMSLEGRTAGLPLISEYENDGGFGVRCRHSAEVTSDVIDWYKENEVAF
jgi:hypothetical protein